jgi:hypothetical protein
MSRLQITNIASQTGTGGIDVESGKSLYSSGMVVQTQFVRSDARTIYSLLVTGNGVPITDLNLNITPKFSSSLLMMQWMVNCEMSVSAWDVVFLIHKNSQLITDPGYEGYNVLGGNNRWSGIAAGMYDNNSDSTMGNYFLQYAIPAFDTNSQTFSLAARSSNATAKNLLLNRTVASTGADAYEVSISTGVIMEIAQ